ncbi:hypothetical protein ANANG_G00087160 [Anguilla anguilla]|uniref:A-kinase anchor protein 2 C-terminal domain-containing protein n=1 Tax=Anguilla anguilla TaxID=7936 RepID=A0A9D3S5J1_ANGAN|nr:hypothetical protein ANANG_G00087160 [Anguilla anguilla]
MESTPKKWVMQPFSPKLEMKDLRTLLSPSTKQTDSETLEASDFSYDSITVMHSQPSVTVTSNEGDSPRDVVVQARQVSVSDESSVSEDWHPSSPSCPSSPSSSGSHCGFYSFEERSHEVEKTEAWMSSPDREAKLAVLKEENGFKLRAYVEERKPEKLFEEVNGDSRYRVEDIEDTEEQGEIKERMEIIRSQAPKIKPAFKEQWSVLESLGLSYSPQRLLEGLSLSFSPVTVEVQQTGVEPGTVDTEQISFSTARQQFVMMEQSKRNPFLQSPQQILQFPEHQEKPSPPEVMVTSGNAYKDGLPEEQLSLSPKSNPDNNPVFTSEMVTVSVLEERGTKMQSSVDDLDSGLEDLSLDPNGGYAYDGSVSNEVLRVESADVPSSASKGETPIEREIRIAQEREESLRRERGIKRTDVKEMVEIKTKPLLSQASPTLTPIKAREKNRVSFLIQREIEQDSRREEDLQHQGKVPGLYDRGTAQELGERKRVFELQEDQIPVTPTKTSHTRNLVDAKQGLAIVDKPTLPWHGLSEQFNMRPRRVDTPDAIRKEIEWDLKREEEHRKLRESGGLSLSLNGGLDSLETASTTMDSSPLQHGDEGGTSRQCSKEEDVRQEKPLPTVLPEEWVAKSGSSLSSPWSTDTVDSKESKLTSPILTSDKIQIKGFASLPSSPSVHLTTRLPSVSIMTPQPWGGHRQGPPALPRVPPLTPQSAGVEVGGIGTQKGLTETLLEDFEERRIKLKLEESSYAGIQPTDDVNNEVLEATRVTRHKNTRALRWEAGMYTNEDIN